MNNPDTQEQANKMRNLYLGILFDAIGMVSYIIPGFMEFTDIIWAPVSGIILSKMYKGNAGKIGGIISFLEEILPFTDVLPTFTLMWFYTYYIKDKPVKIVERP